MKDVVESDLVNERGSEVISRGVDRNGLQGLSSISDGHVFENVVFSGQFTLVSVVIPKPNGRVGTGTGN